MNGGLPGGRSSKLLKRADGSEELLPSKCDRIKVEENDVLYFDTWGGGGWGDPLKRPAEQVAADVDAGLVTRDGAKRYGVVVNEDYSVDESATAKLRKQLAGQRGDTKLFDFGGSIDELKARCLEETGLQPPATRGVSEVGARRDAGVAQEGRQRTGRLVSKLLAGMRGLCKKDGKEQVACYPVVAEHGHREEGRARRGDLHVFLLRRG